jgi:DNA-binding XRE family transcriptional regulator
MKMQIIKKDGKPEWAVVPYEEYQRLVAAAEMLEDVRDYDMAKERITAGEELIPSEVTYAILDGQNPVRVWREYRQLTQQQLADMVEISKPYLSQIESGRRKGTATLLNRLAQALGVSIDDLID